MILVGLILKAQTEAEKTKFTIVFKVNTIVNFQKSEILFLLKITLSDEIFIFSKKKIGFVKVLSFAKNK